MVVKTKFGSQKGILLCWYWWKYMQAGDGKQEINLEWPYLTTMASTSPHTLLTLATMVPTPVTTEKAHTYM